MLKQLRYYLPFLGFLAIILLAQLLQPIIFCSSQSQCLIYPTVFGLQTYFLLFSVEVIFLILIVIFHNLKKLQKTKPVIYFGLIGLLYFSFFIILLTNYIKISDNNLQLHYFPLTNTSFKFEEIQSFQDQNYDTNTSCLHSYSFKDIKQNQYLINTSNFIIQDNLAYNYLTSKIPAPPTIKDICN